MLSKRTHKTAAERDKDVKKKWMWCLVFLVGLCAAPFIGIALYYGPDRITKSNCDRIKKGMTYEDVKSILGGGPNAQRHLYSDGAEMIYFPYWSGEIGRIFVYLDGQRLVSSTDWFPNGFEPHSFDRIHVSHCLVG
jgi:hypothetical protein